MTSSRGLPRSRRAALLAALAAVLLLVPGPTPHPASLSLVRLETAGAVDLGDGVVWVLALGSDAEAGEELTSGRADAIQLIGLDTESRRAVAVGVPRDTYVQVPGHRRDRINVGLQVGGPDDGPELMARMVADLTGITPQYVVTSASDRFADMVDAVGGLRVRSPIAFEDPARELVVGRGWNQLDGPEAAAFAGSRELPGDDFGRSANQQALLRAVLDKVRARQDEEGFLEAGAVAALRGLETNLSPSELYRFAHAITRVDPRRAVTCVLEGQPITRNGASVVRPDRRAARRIGADIRDDARLDRGC
jgi:polyisoprenyl-teichoic acid--peptidoglycan teichoic acid transferase